MNVNPIEAKNSLTEYYKKTSLTDKSTTTAGRARDTAADRSVGFAHGIICLVFESGDNMAFFSWVEPTLRLGEVVWNMYL